MNLNFEVFYYGKVWEKAMTMSNWSDFFAAFFKGPGWFPGTERLGDITFVPERPVSFFYYVQRMKDSVKTKILISY